MAFFDFLNRLRRKKEEPVEEVEEELPVIEDPITSYVNDLLQSSAWTIEILDPESEEGEITDLYGFFQSPTLAMEVLDVSLRSLNAALDPDERRWQGRIRSITPI